MKSDWFLALALASFAAGIVGLIRPTLVRPAFVKPSRGWVVGFYLVLTVTFFVLFGLHSDDERIAAANAPPPSPVAVRESSEPADPMSDLESKIKKVEARVSATVSRTQAGYRVYAEYRPTAVWSESTFVFSAGEALRKTGAQVKASGLPVEEIQFHAFAPSTDAYGNSGMTKAFALTLSRADIDRINWRGITSQQLLNLAKVEFRPLGRKVVAEYCSDQDNLKRTVELCRKLL